MAAIAHLCCKQLWQIRRQRRKGSRFYAKAGAGNH